MSTSRTEKATGLVSDVYHMFKPTMDFTRGFLSWHFVRGQENDGFRSGPLSRIDLAAHTPEDDPDPADHPVITQYLLNRLDRQQGEEHYLAARVFRQAAQWLQAVTGDLPARFPGHVQRHAARTMRTFAGRLSRD